MDELICDDVLKIIFDFFGTRIARVDILAVVSRRWYSIACTIPSDWKNTSLRDGIRDEMMKMFFSKRRDFRSMLVFLKEEVIRRIDRKPLIRYEGHNFELTNPYELEFTIWMKISLFLFFLLLLVGVFFYDSHRYQIYFFIPYCMFAFFIFLSKTNEINWSQIFYYDLLVFVKRKILRLDSPSKRYLHLLDPEKYEKKRVEKRVCRFTLCNSKIIRTGNRVLFVQIPGLRTDGWTFVDHCGYTASNWYVSSRSLRIGWNGLFSFLRLHKLQSKCNCHEEFKKDYEDHGRFRNYIFKEIKGRACGAVDKHLLLCRWPFSGCERMPFVQGEALDFKDGSLDSFHVQNHVAFQK